MELIYITLAVYGMGAATALFPKKMEMAAHYCAVLAAVFGSGALLYQSAAYLMQGSGSLLSGSWAFFTFNADRWSAVFLLITGVPGCSGIVRSIASGALLPANPTSHDAGSRSARLPYCCGSPSRSVRMSD